MYNGYDMKQEARALKNSCKKLGKIFRIPNDLEETAEKESIVKDINIEVEDVVKTKVSKKETTEEVSELEKKIVKAYKEKI
jgi:hypothetical protein